MALFGLFLRNKFWRNFSKICLVFFYIVFEIDWNGENAMRWNGGNGRFLVLLVDQVTFFIGETFWENSPLVKPYRWIVYTWCTEVAPLLINDHYEFPSQLDLDRENGKYLSPEANRSIRNLYTLHRYKFDDERVTKEDIKRALEEQYGGEEELPQTKPGLNNAPFKFTKYSNAYMLVYIRESDKEKIICNVDEKDIAEHLRERLKREQEEKEIKKKEKAEAHLYTIIKVARDEDIVEQIGRDIYFDLVDHDKVRSFRIQKQMPFNIFKEEVAKEFGIPVQFQRFWLWAKRQNHTYRPNRPLTRLEETQTVGQLREMCNKVHNAELKLFLEVELGLDLQPIPPPNKTKDDVLLFFKLYDYDKEELRYVGRLFVKAMAKPTEILLKLNEMAGYAPDEEVDLYEEIKFEPTVMCEPIDKKFAFRSSQLEDGDIVCFQKSLPVETGHQVRYPDVPSFLEYVHNRQVVHFRALEKPKEDDFCLELSKLHTYDDVVERVARQLDLDDPSKIRLTPHNCYSQQPKPQPIKYRGVDHLSDMLVHYNQVSIHTIRLPKQSTVGDVINELRAKVELSRPNAELRLLEVFYHKIYKIFPANEKIENINDQYWTLRAEEIPEEETNLGPLHRLIHVYHFTREMAQNQMQQIQNFGEPFFLVIHEGETLADVKVRIQKKLQVPDEEFAKWKFAFLSLGRPEYLDDSDIVSSRFQRRDVYGAWEQYLGLEHSDNSPKRAYITNQDVVINFVSTTPLSFATSVCSSEFFLLWLKDLMRDLKRKTEKVCEIFKNNLIDFEKLKPIVFKSKDELLNWTMVEGKKRPRMRLACERSGQYRATKKLKHDGNNTSRITGTKKCGCPFDMKAYRFTTHDELTLTIVCRLHNHLPAEHLEGHSYVGRLSKDEKTLLMDMSQSMVQPKEILVTLKQ
ncbi:hypothetical protein HYC85_031074 [Camellia sinensis]|uniref:ubiquitinyl hydrolase 1 n=1 Tax=Camellia sinensis TaxID=4442 RepID=A0A7J7FQL2_CAMSI|nr:hypothetical protein HYC85_031074 [Camellia sinensis]